MQLDGWDGWNGGLLVLLSYCLIVLLSICETSRLAHARSKSNIVAVWVSVMRESTNSNGRELFDANMRESKTDINALLDSSAKKNVADSLEG